MAFIVTLIKRLFSAVMFLAIFYVSGSGAFFGTSRSQFDLSYLHKSADSR